VPNYIKAIRKDGFYLYATCHSRENGNPEKHKIFVWIPNRVGNDMERTLRMTKGSGAASAHG